ncbi:helicase [Coemansia sp. RSA 1813]|nr:helicase [Coemansia sp. RSA 1843]KAJ2211242.1 helicase [Coemansia sp. RSA 487]KAJ2564474.1 helicase [Coemansia sp. RSA 1813]
MAGGGNPKKGKKQLQGAVGPTAPTETAATAATTVKKGKKQSQETVPSTHTEADTISQQLFGKWTGKTPVTLLNEYVQKNAGWQRADYNMRGTAGKHYCVIRMTKVDKKESVTVAFEPTETESMQQKHKSALEARHASATYALHRLRSATTNMHLMLPPTFRAYWSDLEKIRKDDKDKWRYAVDPFATKVARTKEREARVAEREKMQEKHRRAKATGHSEELMRVPVRKRWDELAEVHMSDANRQEVESVIRTWTSSWQLSEPEEGEGEGDMGDDGIVKELVKMGFRKAHVEEALTYTGTRHQALDWLCIHVPEADLPEKFMHRAYRSAPVIMAPADGIGQAAVHAAAKRLARSGFPTSACEAAINQHIASGSIDVAESQAAHTLHGKLCGREAEALTNTRNEALTETVDDELETLEAIYTGEERVTQANEYRVSVALRPVGDESIKDVRLDFWFPPSLRYPEEQLPAITVTSDRMPAYLKLHVARKLDSLVNRDGLPVLFEAVNLADQLLCEWMAAPPLLTELMVGNIASGHTVPLDSLPAHSTATKRSRPQKTTGANARDIGRLAEQFAQLQATDKYQAMQRVRAQLPAARVAQQIVDLVESNQCVVIAGATGCGKTTQVPQFLLDHGLRTTRHVNIICTQPRRISAIGVAGRVAEERCNTQLVGYAVRGESSQSRDTRLLFCTTGVLLRMLTESPDLEGVTHVVCDEVHERSVDSDLLLVLLSACVKRNRALRVVLMSATARSDVFADYFGPATPVVSIPGRTFPVEDVYLEDFVADGARVDAWERRYGRPDSAGTVDYAMAARIVEHIHASAPADRAMLVFMPGVGEIQATIDAIKRLESAVHVLPLHSGLAPQEQRKVFAPPPSGKRKIVVATNIAETSITIDDIGFVLDAGRTRTLVHDHHTRIARLVTTFCSQASATQRRGRAGRVREGTCYRLYTRSMEQQLMPAHDEPEIRRAPLEQVCLQAKAMGYSDSSALLSLTLDPPSTQAIDAAERFLVAVGACGKPTGDLLALGKLMALLPVDLRLAKMLIFGTLFGALDATLPLVALMSLDKPLVTAPFDMRDAARDARICEAPPSALSDWIADLAMYTKYTDATSSAKKSMQFVSAAAVREVKRNVKLLRQGIERTGLIESSSSRDRTPADTMVLKAIILAGLSPNIARVRVPQQKYHEVISGTIGVGHQARELSFYSVDPFAHISDAAKKTPSWITHDKRTDQRLFIHPQSTMFAESKYPVPFITFFSLSATDTANKVYVRDVTVPGIYAILMLGPPLTVDHDNKVVSVGSSGALAVRAWPRIAVLVNRLRSLVDELLRRKMDDPRAVALEGHPVVEAVLRLIRTDGK